MIIHHFKDANHMKNIHPEFAYQSRELGIQIEDTLGDPPDRKNYAKVIKSLIGEFANGTGDRRCESVEFRAGRLPAL